MKDSIKLILKYLCMVDLDFCITYLKNTKFNLVTYLTATKIVLVYPVIVRFTKSGSILPLAKKSLLFKTGAET